MQRLSHTVIRSPIGDGFDAVGDDPEGLRQKAMLRLAASLTELQITKAKPKDEGYFLSDGHGRVT